MSYVYRMSAFCFWEFIKKLFQTIIVLVSICKKTLLFILCSRIVLHNAFRNDKNLKYSKLSWYVNILLG